jgi:hypothetical protein
VPDLVLTRRIVDLTFPLAEIGELPQDLLSAFNGAIYCAQTAEGIFVLISSTDPAYAGDTPGTVVRLLEALKTQRNACREAVLRVTNELNTARKRSVRFGEIKASNAHLAAIKYADKVVALIWQTADIKRWVQCHVDSGAEMNTGIVIDQFRRLHESFHGTSVADVEEIVAAVQLEASQAARNRAKGGKPNHDNSSPRSTPAGGPTESRQGSPGIFNAEVRAIEDQWHSVFSQDGTVIGVSFWDSYLHVLKAICDRYGISLDDPRFFSIRAYQEEKKRIDDEYTALRRANNWANAKEGTPEYQASREAYWRWQIRLIDCRARHFPGWNGLHPDTVDTRPKLWAHIALHLLPVREGAQSLKGSRKDERPVVCEKDVQDVYQLMHTLKIPWTPAPPYEPFTQEEANDELMRIANRLEEEDKEQHSRWCAEHGGLDGASEVIRTELNRLAATPCANPPECLTWCNDAMAWLREDVRLNGDNWSAWSTMAQRLAKEALKRAIELGADAATLAFLGGQQDASSSLMSAASGLAYLQRLAEWCRAQNSTPPGNRKADEGKANGRRRGRQEVTRRLPPSQDGAKTHGPRDHRAPRGRQRKILETLFKLKCTSAAKAKPLWQIVKAVDKTIEKWESWKAPAGALKDRGLIASEGPGRGSGYWLTDTGLEVAKSLR